MPDARVGRVHCTQKNNLRYPLEALCSRGEIKADARPPPLADRTNAQPAARNECAICFEDFVAGTARCVLIPCGHTGFCLACGRAQAACPICRVPVERAQPIYQA